MTRALPIAIVLAACGGRDRSAASSPTGAPIEDSCRETTEASAATKPPAPPPLDPAQASRLSRVVTHATVALTPVAKELEARVPVRVADERDRSIGMAGRLNVTADRGPFAVAVEREALVIRTEVRAHAEACKGSRCYASCDPVGLATATVPLRLEKDYRFAPSRVAFAFTRGCEVKALGGFVKIDVTPTIRGQLEPVLRKVAQEIDTRMPNPRKEVEALWKQLSKRYEVPLGGCAALRPSGLVQGPIAAGPASPRGATLRARFALIASPVIEPSCDPIASSLALPPLTHDPAMPAEDDVRVAIVVPLDGAASALASMDAFRIDGGGRASLSAAKLAPAGPLVDVDATLRGDVCGETAFRAALAWSAEGRSLVLASPEPATRDARAIVSAARVPMRITAGMLRDVAPVLASAASDANTDITATVHEAAPDAVFVRETAQAPEIVAFVRVRGSAEIARK